MANPENSSFEADANFPHESQVDDIAAVSEVISTVRKNVETVIVGNSSEIDHILTTMLARGHVLIEDRPGVGKTMLSRAIARSFEGDFKRIQFIPDLLPADVTGINVYNEKINDFEFRHGPVFANVVLGDEINRSPPKTQSALLEAMNENQVTVDGKTRKLPNPFTVIATQNSVGDDHAYDLPIAELDRFMKKIALGYPEEDEEIDMLDRTTGEHPIETISPVATLRALKDAREITANISTVEHIRSYTTDIASFTREHAQMGLSPRGTMQLLRAAQARAVINGRDYVIPDDVKTEASVVIPHRIRADTDRSPKKLVREALSTVDPE